LSEEVGHDYSVRLLSLFFPDFFEQSDVPLTIRTDLQHRGSVPASVAIVGRGPDGAEDVFEDVLEAFLDQLMRAADQLQVVRLEEFVHHVSTE